MGFAVVGAGGKDFSRRGDRQFEALGKPSKSVSDAFFASGQ
jgi:hypothetical protein